MQAARKRVASYERGRRDGILRMRCSTPSVNFCENNKTITFRGFGIAETGSAIRPLEGDGRLLVDGGRARNRHSRKRKPAGSKANKVLIWLPHDEHRECERICSRC